MREVLIYRLSFYIAPRIPASENESARNTVSNRPRKLASWSEAKTAILPASSMLVNTGDRTTALSSSSTMRKRLGKTPKTGCWSPAPSIGMKKPSAISLSPFTPSLHLQIQVTPGLLQITPIPALKVATSVNAAMILPRRRALPNSNTPSCSHRVLVDSSQQVRVGYPHRTLGRQAPPTVRNRSGFSR